MKYISQLLLLVITIFSLIACDSGKGPSKPTGTNNSNVSIK